MSVIPVFSSHHSVLRKTLTLDDPDDKKIASTLGANRIDNSESVSIFLIAKLYNLKEFYLCDQSFSGFIEFSKGCDKFNIDGRFGIKFIISNNAKEKSEDSRKTESKIVVWMKNSAGYKDLIKLYSAIHANEENFYYHIRGDWSILKDFWTNNLLLTIPFYDSFLYKNLLESGQCIPDFGKISPVFELSELGLPFDYLIKEKVLNYSKDNKNEIIETHPIYYYSKSDFISYMTSRCISARTTLNKPELPHMSVNTFCWEEYCNRNNIQFKA